MARPERAPVEGDTFGFGIGNLTRPVIETVYIGQKPGRAAMEDLARQINGLPE